MYLLQSKTKRLPSLLTSHLEERGNKMPPWSKYSMHGAI